MKDITERTKNKTINRFYFTCEDIKKCGGSRQALVFSYFRAWIGFNKSRGYMLSNGYTWNHFSYHKLEGIFCLSRNTLKRLVNQLVEKGLLVKGKHLTGSGGHSSKVMLGDDQKLAGLRPKIRPQFGPKNTRLRPKTNYPNRSI